MAAKKKYTDEHINFLKEYAPTHTISETWESFFDKFEMDITESTIRYLISLHDIPYKRIKTEEPKNVIKCGGKNQPKKKFRRTQFQGTKELYNAMEEVCADNEFLKYELSNNAVKHFLKHETGISTPLKRKPRNSNTEKSVSINTEIPVRFMDKLDEIATKNNCTVNVVMAQALVNYCVFMLPEGSEYSTNLITTGLYQTKNNIDATKITHPHRWTEQEENYIRMIAPENTTQTICTMFHSAFGNEVTDSAIKSYMFHHGIKPGKKSKCGRRPNTDISAVQKPNTSKYYIDGMEELSLTTNLKNQTNNKEEPNQKDILPVENKTPDSLSNNSTNDNSILYHVPEDTQKIIFDVRKITESSKFEFLTSALNYYFTEELYINKKLFPNRYDAKWLNKNINEQFILSLSMIDSIQYAANKLHCSSSIVILQAILDYAKKVFKDNGNNVKFVFDK